MFKVLPKQVFVPWIAVRVPAFGAPLAEWVPVIEYLGEYAPDTVIRIVKGSLAIQWDRDGIATLEAGVLVRSPGGLVSWLNDAAFAEQFETTDASEVTITAKG